MENKKIISYKEFLVPEMLTGVSFEKEFLEGAHSFVMEKFVGSSVRIIVSQEIPAWNMLIVFEELRRLCPEVCVRVGASDLVLHSIFSRKECFLTEDVLRFRELLEGGLDWEQKDIQKEVDFDLSKNGVLQDEERERGIAEMKKVTIPVQQVLFFGEADGTTVLVWYVLWMKRAKHLLYRKQKGKEYRFF